jgi:CheY-like chemotaxis protein
MLRTPAVNETPNEPLDRRDEFLALIAHELRNPLAPIRNSISLLRRSSDPRVVQVCDMIERQVRRMVRVVDDLADLSSLSRGPVELHKDEVDLVKVIEAVVDTCRPQIEAAGHRLELALPAQPLWLEADSERLAQVFANLLDNAVKYTDPGGRLGVRARRDDGNAFVAVSDSGIGIPADVLGKVFDMFVQADARTRRAPGLGIGLTLARSLVEAHGGGIEAHSAGAGMGSEFVVRLPLGLRHSEPRGVPAADPGARPPRVLVVDDNHDAADSLGALLEMLGAEVCVTHDGPAALQAFDSFHPAAVFLDLGMAGMDGYEVAGRIRARRDARNTVLVALTGWGRDKDRRRTQAAGFDHHLVKPGNMDAIEDLLATLPS